MKLPYKGVNIPTRYIMFTGKNIITGNEVPLFEILTKVGLKGLNYSPNHFEITVIEHLPQSFSVPLTFIFTSGSHLCLAHVISCITNY